MKNHTLIGMLLTNSHLTIAKKAASLAAMFFMLGLPALSGFAQETGSSALPRSGLFANLQTNMLYDAAAMPNLGAEVYLGKNISLTANFICAWWSNTDKYRFWRTNAGTIAGRYWFGSKAHAKPLTGHHAGIYASALIYDFEWGGKGYLGGTPGKNIFHNPSYSFGLEYGYSLPVSRRFNIDFTLGVGYFGGKYYEYNPVDGHFMWQATRRRNWVGPTRLEVNLVWQIGRSNTNISNEGVR